MINLKDKNPMKALVVSIDDLKSQAREAGVASAAGNDTILGLGLKVYANAKLNGLKAGDVREIYIAYAEGQNDGQFGAKVDLSNKDSVKSGASKLAVFHKLASVPGKRAHFSMVTKAISAINGKLAADGKLKPGASHYERVLKVLRETIKRGDQELMTPAEIVDFVFPPAADKTIDDNLEAMAKTAQRFVDAYEDPRDAYHFAQVLDAINAQIDARKAASLDGVDADEDGPDVSEEDREELEALLAA